MQNTAVGILQKVERSVGVGFLGEEITLGKKLNKSPFLRISSERDFPGAGSRHDAGKYRLILKIRWHSPEKFPHEANGIGQIPMKIVMNVLWPI